MCIIHTSAYKYYSRPLKHMCHISRLCHHRFSYVHTYMKMPRRDKLNVGHTHSVHVRCQRPYIFTQSHNFRKRIQKYIAQPHNRTTHCQRSYLCYLSNHVVHVLSIPLSHSVCGLQKAPTDTATHSSCVQICHS